MTNKNDKLRPIPGIKIKVSNQTNTQIDKRRRSHNLRRGWRKKKVPYQKFKIKASGTE